MDRRRFTTTCIGCVSSVFIAPLLTACQSTHYVAGTIESDRLAVPKAEFTYLKKDQPIVREYIIVRNERLEFPIYLYRFSENEYSAVLMKCTHQGNELNASGDHLHCSAHGSEFNNQGIVAQGPAEANLRAFRISTDAANIFIDLRS
jgi:Rieske Fe-S protein